MWCDCMYVRTRVRVLNDDRIIVCKANAVHTRCFFVSILPPDAYTYYVHTHIQTHVHVRPRV